MSHQQHNEYQRELFTDSIDFFRQPVPEEVRERTSFIVACAKLKASDRVLDVGTGTGALIPDIERWGVSEIVGCDLCEAMIEEAREKHPSAQFWCGDVMHLPLDLGVFDVCFLNAMFGNVWNQSRTLLFLATRLATGGRVVVSHPLGAAFVEQLHRTDPRMVPHSMPNRDSMLDMIRGTSLSLSRFVDEPGLYLCVLTKAHVHQR
jgi:riboflavin kinase